VDTANLAANALQITALFQCRAQAPDGNGNLAAQWGIASLIDQSGDATQASMLSAAVRPAPLYGPA